MTALRLVDVEVRAREHPATFEIPELRERASLREGDFAKLIFDDGDPLWVRVTFVGMDWDAPHYVGVSVRHYDARLVALPDEFVAFRPEHVCAICRSTKGETP